MPTHPFLLVMPKNIAKRITSNMGTRIFVLILFFAFLRGRNKLMKCFIVF